MKALDTSLTMLGCPGECSRKHLSSPELRPQRWLVSDSQKAGEMGIFVSKGEGTARLVTCCLGLQDTGRSQPP